MEVDASGGVEVAEVVLVQWFGEVKEKMTRCLTQPLWCDTDIQQVEALAVMPSDEVG